MDVQTLINDLEFEEETAVTTPDDIAERAMIEAGRIARDNLRDYHFYEAVGRVALVLIEPSCSPCPIMPVIIGGSAAITAAAGAFLAVMQKTIRQSFYRDAGLAGARYVQSAQNYLTPQELKYLKRQINLCCVDPKRELIKL